MRDTTLLSVILMFVVELIFLARNMTFAAWMLAGVMMFTGVSQMVLILYYDKKSS